MKDHTIILPPLIWPNTATISCIKNGSKVVWDFHEHYQKKSYRNKYEILGPNGRQTLSVHLLKGKNYQMPTKDVLISYIEPWHTQHLQALRTAYGRSPYFEYYYPYIEQLYLSKPSHLVDLNMKAFDLTKKWLKIEIEINTSEAYIPIKSEIDEGFVKKYSQVFEYKFGFESNLSILDLVFCAGPEAGHYI